MNEKLKLLFYLLLALLIVGSLGVGLIYFSCAYHLETNFIHNIIVVGLKGFTLRKDRTWIFLLNRSFLTHKIS